MRLRFFSNVPPLLILATNLLPAVLVPPTVYELWGNNYRFDVRLPPGHDGELAYAAPYFFGVAVQNDATIFKVVNGPTETIHILAQYDQFGMRSRKPVSEFPHRHNIALVGDSYTWGAENTYPDTLQGQMELAFPDANVLNFGIPGSNSVYFATAAKNFLARTGKKLDLAVVGIYTDPVFGDISRMAAIDRYGDHVIFDRVAVSRTSYQSLTKSPWLRMKLSTTVTARRLSSTFNLLFPPNISEEFALPVFDNSDRAIEEWRERIVSNLRRLSVATALPPSRIVVWFIPSKYNLYDASRYRFWADTAARLSDSGFDIVDVKDAIRDLSLKEVPYTASGHFRPAVYSAVTKLIVPHVASILEDRKPHEGGQ